MTGYLTARRGTTAGKAGWALLVCLALAGCDPGFPVATPVPSPVPTGTAIPTSVPVPTAVPAVPLTVHWPAAVSALEEVAVRVDLPGLAERDPNARVRAFVRDPLHQVWWESDLEPEGDRTYVAPVALRLPLEPPPGEWRLTVLVLATVPVSGEWAVYFSPEPVPMWDLRQGGRAGVILHVPRAFIIVRTEGDQVAGRRVWRGAGGEVILAWAPGPDEPLTRDTAQMMLEASHSTSWPAEILSVEPAEWRGLTAFRFGERWPQGPAETLVVQGPDLWLYLIRVRALDGGAISPLLREVQTTFGVEE